MSRNPASHGWMVLVVALLGSLTGCDGMFTLSFQFVIPDRVSDTETQTLAIPPGAALVVNNDNGSTRVSVDPNATEATIEITRIALAENRGEAENLLNRIEVTVEPPDAGIPNLRVTARKPISATGNSSEFNFDVMDDQIVVTGILSARTVALVQLRITLPAGHAVQVTSENGAIRTLGLDTASSLTTKNGRIRVTDSMAALTLDTDNGSLDIEDHTGSLNATTRNGSVEIDLLDLAAGDHVTAETSNGRIRLRVPSGIDAELRAMTDNGIVLFRAQDFDSLANVTADVRDVTTTLNAGGPIIDLSTRNGTISIDGR
ncbi:MAG: DUF4097 domain-containing protein [Phycisphaerae bacterium]